MINFMGPWHHTVDPMRHFFHPCHPPRRRVWPNQLPQLSLAADTCSVVLFSWPTDQPRISWCFSKKSDLQIQHSITNIIIYSLGCSNYYQGYGKPQLSIGKSIYNKPFSKAVSVCQSLCLGMSSLQLVPWYLCIGQVKVQVLQIFGFLSPAVEILQDGVPQFLRWFINPINYGILWLYLP